MSWWKGKRVLVTGGAGMIGSHLVEMLLGVGAAVDVLDDMSRGQEVNLPKAGIRIWRYMLGSEGGPGWNYMATNAFAGKDIVFHLAAKVAGIGYNYHHQFDMLQSNLAINCDVAKLISRHQPERYIYVSTACVYSHDAPIPTYECWGDVCNPEPTNWGYGVAKWVGEQQAKLIHQELGVETAIVRFFNAAGPRDYYDEETSHVIPALIRRFMEGDNPVVVWGTGLQRRVFVDCRDLAKSLMLTAQYGCDGKPTNVGHADDISIGNLAHLIQARIGSNKANIEFAANRPEGYPTRAADITRLKHLTGWKPEIPLMNTIDDMIADYQQRYPNGYTD